MNFKVILSMVFILLVVFLLGFYWFIPLGSFEFEPFSQNFNFTSNPEILNMQFYENMRFSEKEISYNIVNCPLNKKDEMERAFLIIDNLSIINFYPVSQNEEIYVTCDSGTKFEGGLFIAGEGGPTDVVSAGNFNVILKGKILLLRESKCAEPNVAIHELLHVLGFNHSDNPKNIMYPISNCNQEIGQDTLNLLNKIYSCPNQPDVVFEDISAIRTGTFFDMNLSLRNYGLMDSDDFKIFIYADDKQISEIEVDSLSIGAGRMIILSNIFSLKKEVDELKFVIDYFEEELNKENNIEILKIKK